MYTRRGFRSSFWGRHGIWCNWGWPWKLWKRFGRLEGKLRRGMSEAWGRGQGRFFNEWIPFRVDLIITIHTIKPFIHLFIISYMRKWKLYYMEIFLLWNPEASPIWFWTLPYLWKLFHRKLCIKTLYHYNKRTFPHKIVLLMVPCIFTYHLFLTISPWMAIQKFKNIINKS